MTSEFSTNQHAVIAEHSPYIGVMRSIIAHRASLAAGGGPFALPHVTIGVFLVDQPTHHLSLGATRRSHLPLHRNEGWLLPEGADGVCEYDNPLEVVTVSVAGALLREAGGDGGAVVPVVGPLDPLLTQMALSADRFAAGGTLYAETMAHALAAHLVAVVRPQPADLVGIDDRRLRRAIEYVRAHLGEDLSLEAMAAEAAMSGSHFAKSFKAATGRSPLQFVIAERMAAAIVLLRTTKLTVAEVAHRVGYRDVPRFGQHFKRHHGMTPARARQ
ncbi:MAG: AraC family transcriptional regulator [Pseudomonadota bacterium]